MTATEDHLKPDNHLAGASYTQEPLHASVDRERTAWESLGSTHLSFFTP